MMNPRSSTTTLRQMIGASLLSREACHSSYSGYPCSRCGISCSLVCHSTCSAALCQSFGELFMIKSQGSGSSNLQRHYSTIQHSEPSFLPHFDESFKLIRSRWFLHRPNSLWRILVLFEIKSDSFSLNFPSGQMAQKIEIIDRSVSLDYFRVAQLILYQSFGCPYLSLSCLSIYQQLFGALLIYVLPFLALCSLLTTDQNQGFALRYGQRRQKSPCICYILLVSRIAPADSREAAGT